MRHLTLTTLAILTALLTSSAGSALATAAFEDGFEDGLSTDKWFWDLHNWRGTKNIVTTNPHSGSKALYMEGADWHPQCSNMQSLPTLSLESARIDIWFRDLVLNSGSGGDGHVHIYMYNDAGDYIGAMYEALDHGDGTMHFKFAGQSGYNNTGYLLRNLSGWNKLSVLYEADETGSVVELLVNDTPIQTYTIGTNFGNLGYIVPGVGGQYHNWAAWTIDDVSISSGGSEVPEPATLLAGIAGLAGIGRYLRRRK